ncbi:MAG: large subunit ribosomal protein L10 [Parcubacteria group bacterium Gr01-1014_66]|nr:MAG: large subunit ribosomal protein L10 [Parcubacteria group bacterium Gr01-1014_66]
MRTKKEKEQHISSLQQKLERQKITIISTFHGVSVNTLRVLRRSLKKADAEYKVVKKTLFDRALRAVNIDESLKMYKNEIGVAFGYTDEILSARTLVQFSKENPSFQILCAILNRRLLDSAEVINLAKLPGRDVLLQQLMYAGTNPLRNFLNVIFAAHMRNLCKVLQQIAHK